MLNGDSIAPHRNLINPRQRPVPSSRLPVSAPFAAFSKYVRQPTGEMPPYTKKVVSDPELADIYAYLKSIPQPPAAKSIPILNH
jgi:hypothetical protein